MSNGAGASREHPTIDDDDDELEPLFDAAGAEPRNVPAESKEVNDFVKWCRLQQRRAPHNDARSSIESALKLLRKEEMPHHASLASDVICCDYCRRGSDRCDACTARTCRAEGCEECEAGRWARYANQLRRRASVCAVAEEVIRVVEDALCGGWDDQRQSLLWSDAAGRTCWNWDLDENCLCSSCVRLGSRIDTLYLYSEKLIRAVPWFLPVDLELQPGHGPQSSQLPPVLQRAVNHWGFFGKLQEFAARFADRPHTVISRGDTFFASVPPDLRDNETGYMNCDCHATIAALNHLRRLTGADEPRVLKELRGSIKRAMDNCSAPGAVAFQDDYARFNFEGTYEDHYCLGSRGPIADVSNTDRGEFSMSIDGASKWYVGTTQDKVRRHAEHGGADPRIEGRSSFFIRFMTSCAYQGRHRVHSAEAARAAAVARRDGLPDEFGGWKVASREERAKEAWWVQRSAFTRMDEDKRAELMAIVFGQRHVRGSIYTSPHLAAPARAGLEVKRRHVLNLCFRCGGIHFASSGECPGADDAFNDWTGNPVDAAHVQSADDDEALRTWRGLRVSYNELHPDEPDTPADRTTANFARARSVASVLCEGNLSLCQAVMLSSGIEEEEADEEEAKDQPEWYRLVQAIWPPPPPMPPTGAAAPADDGVAARLRPAQKRALRAVVGCRHNLVLCLPTAYGKTRIFLTAAVHEVLHGRGKAVVFLPYKALMADIARTFEEISNGLLGLAERSAHLAPPTRYDQDPRVQGTSTAYGGSMYVLEPYTSRLRKVQWTRWQGKSGDPNMRHHETTDEFKGADIVLVTPDKWMLPASQGANGADACDCFIRAFGKRATEFGLAVVDEAHQFSGVLGGSTRELLRRMRLLCERDSERPSFRVILASATIPQPERFAQMLLPGQPCHLIQASEGRPHLQPEGAESAVHMLTEAADDSPDGRHRLLLFHRGSLGITDVCRDLLKYEALGKHGVRRVLLFCDSKQLASRFVERLRTPRFKKDAKWPDHFEIFATPYHGDCANMHRRVYERLFGGWVRANQLHVIVATSALEAGVNICGPDVVIVLDAATCSRASLVQRIGRGGRVAGRPAVVVIGVDPTQLPQLLEEDADDGARGAIESYLFDVDEPPPVALTRAMVVHGAVQHARNLQKLASLCGRDAKASAWTDSRSARADLATLFSEYGHYRSDDHDHAHEAEVRARVSIEQLEAELRQEGKRETPRFGSDQSARGMGMSTVTLLKVTREGRFERPYGPHDDEERPVPNAFVEVAALDVLRALRLAHPDAHYLTPHGAIYRVRGYTWSCAVPNLSNSWLQKLKAVKVYPISRAQRDEHYYCVTKSEWDSRLLFVSSADDEVTRLDNGVLRRGTFQWTMEWRGFTYHSKFDNGQVGERVAPHGCRHFVDGGPFFTPARWDVGGWEWRVRVQNGGFGESGIRHLVRLELWLRFAHALGCAVQQIEVLLLGREDEQDDSRTDVLEPLDSRLPRLGGGVVALQMAEGATTGLPSEALRRMQNVLQIPPAPPVLPDMPQCDACPTCARTAAGAAETPHALGYLLEDRSWRVCLRGHAPPSDLVDAHKFEVLEAIAHLREQWHAACGGGWVLRETQGKDDGRDDDEQSEACGGGCNGGGGCRTDGGNGAGWEGAGGRDVVSRDSGHAADEGRRHRGGGDSGARGGFGIGPGTSGAGSADLGGGVSPLPRIRKPPILNPTTSQQAVPDLRTLARSTFSAFYVPLIFSALGVLHPSDVEQWRKLLNGPLVCGHSRVEGYLQAQPFLSTDAVQAFRDHAVFEFVLRAVRQALCLLGPVLVGRPLVLQADASFSDADARALYDRLKDPASPTYVRPADQQHVLDPRPRSEDHAPDAMDALHIALRAVEAHYGERMRPSLLCPLLMMAGMHFSMAR